MNALLRNPKKLKGKGKSLETDGGMIIFAEVDKDEVIGRGQFKFQDQLKNFRVVPFAEIDEEKATGVRALIEVNTDRNGWVQFGTMGYFNGEDLDMWFKIYHAQFIPTEISFSAKLKENGEKEDGSLEYNLHVKRNNGNRNNGGF